MIMERDNRADPDATDTARNAPERLLLADVRRDMVAIFGETDTRACVAPPHARPLRLGEALPRPFPPARHRGAVGPVVTAALAGLILGMAAIGAPRLIGRMTTAAPAARATATVAASPFETVPSSPVDTPRTAPAASAPPARLASIEQPARKPAAPPAKIHAPAERGAQCEGDRLERHWCMRQDILKADRDLRLAYANAIHEGVERRFLVAHQRRWTRLRDRASSDPDGVVAGYRELAEDLDRLSVNGRRRDRIS